MIQSKILIFSTFLEIICIAFADDIETLQKDIKKLKNKDKQILKKLDSLTENHDVIDAAIEELETKQNLLESLFDELEQKDLEMNQTLEEFKNKQLEFDEMIEEIIDNAWFVWGQWSEWSECENGGKTRTRECPGVHCLGEGTNTEVEECWVI